jgi:hypothetical protein
VAGGKAIVGTADARDGQTNKNVVGPDGGNRYLADLKLGTVAPFLDDAEAV